MLKDGKVKGIKGHHRNTVNGNSLESAADPNNIQFLTHAEHTAQHAKYGGSRGVITGKLPLDRSAKGTLRPLPGRTDPNKWKTIGFAFAAGFLQRLDAIDPVNVVLIPVENVLMENPYTLEPIET